MQAPRPLLTVVGLSWKLSIWLQRETGVLPLPLLWGRSQSQVRCPWIAPLTVQRQIKAQFSAVMCNFSAAAPVAADGGDLDDKWRGRAGCKLWACWYNSKEKYGGQAECPHPTLSHCVLHSFSHTWKSSQTLPTWNTHFGAFIADVSDGTLCCSLGFPERRKLILRRRCSFWRH